MVRLLTYICSNSSSLNGEIFFASQLLKFRYVLHCDKIHNIKFAISAMFTCTVQ